MKKYLYFLIIVLAVSCQRINYPNELTHIMKAAGKNRKELIKSIDYFQTKKDTMQLDALYFLLQNMENHSYYQAALYDTLEQEIEFKVLDYENYDQMIIALDSLEALHGELNWDLKEKKPDVKFITAELLIENIEKAFEIWRTRPWSQKYDYDVFREYILPYRGSNEPLETWRSYFISKYDSLGVLVKDAEDPVSVAEFINQDLRTYFGFDSRFYCNPTDQGLSEMLTNKIGRCEDMTNITIYALRANGIALTSDYTPYWADTANNHAWNAVINAQGKAVPFMGCEADPGAYELRPIIAKVYRKTFSQQENNLAFQLPDGEKAPAWLRGKNYLDVTSDYREVRDVNIKLREPVPDSINFAYICVFNSGEWKAINWGKINGDKVIFKDMGIGICYLPMYYVDDELTPTGSPFILTHNGEIRELKGSDKICPVRLRSTTKKSYAEISTNKDLSYLIPGSEYELFVWDKEWVSKGKKKANKVPLLYCNLEGERLYWLVKKNSRKQERIFTYENNLQIWW